MNGGADQAGAFALNLEAALFATAVREMAHLIENLGGNARFAADYPGAGDLFVTCQGGRSTKAGFLLGKGIQSTELADHLPGVTLEGVDLIKQIGRSLPDIADYPLLNALADVILDGQPPQIVVNAAFQHQ